MFLHNITVHINTGTVGDSNLVHICQRQGICPLAVRFSAQKKSGVRTQPRHVNGKQTVARSETNNSSQLNVVLSSIFVYGVQDHASEGYTFDWLLTLSIINLFRIMTISLKANDFRTAHCSRYLVAHFGLPTF